MVTKKIRWGVLSTAAIGMKQVLPAMKLCRYASLEAIASRGLAKAQAAATEFGIAKAYGSYEELLADAEIDAVYIPLPNQMHVPWAIKAAEAGKHVLSEKPLSLTAEEAKTLLAVRERTGVRIGEAFMIRCHPQWLRVEELIRSGEIGELLAVSGIFSYYLDDPANIRNQPECGGGALYDIGCYLIQAARAGFGTEPKRVAAVLERDPRFLTDQLTSALIDFGGHHAIFTCSMQMIPYQRVQFLGTKGRIEIEIPFNSPNRRPTRIFVDTTGALDNSGIRTEEFPTCDQYTLQGDAFSLAVLEGREVPVPLEAAIRNMAVIDAIFKAAERGEWVTV